MRVGGNRAPLVFKLALHRLKLLVGDNARVAQAIAGKVGLTTFRANLMPITTIRELNQTFSQTATVGDGVNDAPA